MAGKALYRTKQMSELLLYLKSVQGRHITVNEIEEHFKNKGIAIGTTTIYRHLERMAADGTVVKYRVGAAEGACFEYVGGQGNCGHPAYYHCKCEKCGRLIHLKCSEIADLNRHILEEHGFQVDSAQTVYLGICDLCRAEQANTD